MPRWMKIACVVSMFCSYAAILTWMVISFALVVFFPGERTPALGASMIALFMAAAVFGYGPGIIVWFFERRSAKTSVARV